MQIVDARRIGDELDGMSQFALRLSLGLHKLLANTVIRQLRQSRMRHRMRLNRDAAPLHLAHLIPREISLALAQETRDDKDRRLEVILFQNGKRIGIVINVAIVKRDEHRTLGQSPRACQIVV